MVNLEQCAIIIRQICDATEPGKKMVQKLFYLMAGKHLFEGSPGPIKSRL